MDRLDDPHLEARRTHAEAHVQKWHALQNAKFSLLKTSIPGISNEVLKNVSLIHRL
jgi:hypothetical protein